MEQASRASQSASDTFVSVAFTIVIGLLLVVTLGVSDPWQQELCTWGIVQLCTWGIVQLCVSACSAAALEHNLICALDTQFMICVLGTPFMICVVV